MLVALLALTGLFVALYLTLYKTGAIGEITCSLGSCETVNTSRWSTLLGLPVAAWGLGFYIVTLIVAIAGTQERWVDDRAPSVVLVALSGWGVLFSAWLTYLELFVIHAVCMWCIISAIIVTLIFITSMIDLRDYGKGGAVLADSSPSSPPSDPRGQITRA
jgi:uncharacterized membrane protein